MKKFIACCLLFISVNAFATTRFVGTDGNDANDGRDNVGFDLSGASFNSSLGLPDTLEKTGAFASYTPSTTDYIYIGSVTAGKSALYTNIEKLNDNVLVLNQFVEGTDITEAVSDVTSSDGPDLTFAASATAASDGDTILVGAGTYTTAISFTSAIYGSKSLTFTANIVSGGTHPLVSVNTANGALGIPAASFAAAGTAEYNYIDFTNTNNRIFLFNDVASAFTMKVNHSTWASGTASASLLIGSNHKWSVELDDITWSASGLYFIASQSGDHISVKNSNLTTTGATGGNPIDFTYGDVAVNAYGTTPCEISGNTFTAASLVNSAIIDGVYLDSGTFVISGNTFGTESAPVKTAIIEFRTKTDSNDTGEYHILIESNKAWVQVLATGGSNTYGNGHILVGYPADTATDTDSDSTLNSFTSVRIINNEIYANEGDYASNAVGMMIGPDCPQSTVVAFNKIHTRAGIDIVCYIRGLLNGALFYRNEVWGRSSFCIIGASHLVFVGNTTYQQSGTSTTSPFVIRDGNAGSPEPVGNIFVDNLIIADGTAFTAIEYHAHLGDNLTGNTDIWAKNTVYASSHTLTVDTGSLSETKYDTRAKVDAHWQSVTGTGRLNDSTLYSNENYAYKSLTKNPVLNGPGEDLRIPLSSGAKGTKHSSNPSLIEWNDAGAWQILGGEGGRFRR